MNKSVEEEVEIGMKRESLKKKQEDVTRFREENYEPMMRQFEEDRKTHDFHDSIMDTIFEMTLNEVRNKRILRSIEMFLGIVVSVVALFGIINVCTKTVSGKS